MLVTGINTRNQKELMVLVDELNATYDAGMSFIKAERGKNSLITIKNAATDEVMATGTRTEIDYYLSGFATAAAKGSAPVKRYEVMATSTRSEIDYYLTGFHMAAAKAAPQPS